MKKIYPKEWVKLHPYRQTDDIDHYYTDIANQIYQVLQTHLADGMFDDDEDIRYASLCLTAWFEDVISQIGIWTTFTAECKKRYGNWLPFYPLNEEYYPDEINPEDIQFLLWHHIQTCCRGEGRVINPENPAIAIIANEIYFLLDKIYETAPENERLWQFMHPKEKGIEGFDKHRLVLQWFHYDSYFNIENEEQYWDEMEGWDESLDEDWQNKQKMIRYSIYTSLMLKGRRDLLSLPSCEWLALWTERNDGPQDWRTTKESLESYFLLTEEDSEFLYLQDLCAKTNVYKVFKESFDLKKIKKRQVGKSTIYCTLLHYGNAWCQMGILVMSPSLDDDIKSSIEDMCKEKEHLNEKAVYKDFMKATGGKPFHFCKSRQEMIDFFTHDLKYNIAKDVELPPTIKADHGMVLMVSPRNGLYVQTRLCECIKSPDNAFYDAKVAAQKALAFLLNPDVIPYDLSCMLQDKGMLPDAALNSLKGEAYGRKFLQQNAHFLTDYFFHRCREKDYND